jgi:lipopolysaccharide export system protein LptA
MSMVIFFQMNNKLHTCRNFCQPLMLACFSLLLWAGAAHADPGKAKSAPAPMEKITIDADQMKMNLNTGSSTYTGNVRIRQGDLILTGDRVTMVQTDNALQKLTVIGNPARYNHVTQDGESIVAQSQHMVYIAAENRLIMTDQASLSQPDHKVSSQRIVYDTLNRIVMAGEPQDDGKPTEQQRVNITITPKSPSDKN